MPQIEMGSRFELRFWTQIMGDHARFIKNSLNPDQTNSKLIADNFIRIFDRYYQKVSQLEEPPETAGFLSDISGAVISLREFKRELLAARLQNLPVTSLTPTVYNHMLNELEEFLKVLDLYESGNAYANSLLGRHLLWTLDAAGHAAMLDSALDKVEYKLHTEIKAFENHFDRLYLKIVEITGYFRSNPPAVQPVLNKYNLETATVMQRFMEFLLELREGIMKQQVLGKLSPLEPDHMWREECYYLLKIAESASELPKPDCDPSRPRIVS